MSNLSQTRVYPDELLEWLGRTPSPAKLVWLGISLRQYRIWLNRPEGIYIPVCLYRLMAYQGTCHMAELLGNDWRDFYIRGDKVEFSGIKYPIPAKDFRGLWLKLQENRLFLHEVERLKAEITRLSERTEALEKENGFYRHQLHLESKLGMMLTRIAD